MELHTDNKIANKLGKPSAVVQAIIDGLRRQSQRDDFRIDMNIFGDSDGVICFGCAATCAVQEVFQFDFKGERDDLCGPDARWDALVNYAPTAREIELKMSDLRWFENVVDDLRCGYWIPLFQLYGIALELALPLVDEAEYFLGVTESSSFYMDNSNWESLLPQYERLAEFLRSKGL